jgi:cation diffusion facilitator CzcD-associated flavoprotein CzcO
MNLNEPQHDVLIVGSGFAGLCMAVRLKRAGIDNFVLLEKDQEFGGTWWANTYPGCAVDIPSHLYSFSFARNAGWTRRFARQEELLAYTRSVVRDFGLAPHIRLGTAFEGADFDEAGGYWRARTSAGALTAKCLVAAPGSLNRAVMPPLPGLAEFAGTMFHSSRWEHGYDLRGKRVAVIGTGASAIQFVPWTCTSAVRRGSCRVPTAPSARASGACWRRCRRCSGCTARWCTCNSSRAPFCSCIFRACCARRSGWPRATCAGR